MQCWAYVAEATVLSIHKDLRHPHASIVFPSNTSLSPCLESNPCILKGGLGHINLGITVLNCHNLFAQTSGQIQPG